MIKWLEFLENEQEINPATGKPIMTFDMYQNIMISFRRHGGKEEFAGYYVFDDPETREAATEEAKKYYPAELGYKFFEKDGKYVVQLTGE